MRRRTSTTLFAAAAIIAALAALLVLRKNAPPESARLLPESDAIIYLKLSTLRAATHFDSSPITPSPDLQRFIDSTGIVPERDLDEAAFALHRMPDPHGPNGPVAYSEVFTGHFDGTRLARYLASIATARESYAGHDIFSIPMEGRTLRVAALGYDTVAASNMPTAEQIHSILDRHRTAGLWQPGSSLLAARYTEVPLLSQAWAIGHIGLPFADRGHISVLGLELPLAEDTDLVASLRYTGAVNLRVEEIAPNADTATRTADALSALLNFFRTVQEAQPATTPAASALRAIVTSVTIEHHKSRATVTAAATPDLLRALTAKP